MQNNQPVLSICIPTYNRAGYLYFTLKSITEQDIFKNTHEIEVVISDNCSTDFTEEIAKIFTEQFPDKILYNKNEQDMDDKNFEISLQLAHGEVLKLHNDNFIFVEGSLEKLVNLIKSNREEKPILFFANGNAPCKENKTSKDLNEFIQDASFLNAWIAAFSFWKEDFDKFENFGENAASKLIQTDVLLKSIHQGKKVFILNDVIFDGQGVLKKGGYNIAKVFGINYLEFLKPYVKNGFLDKTVYENEKKTMLLDRIIPMKFSDCIRGKGWKFKDDGYWKPLFKNYWYNSYFYSSIFKILKLSVDSYLNLIGRALNPNDYQKYWRKRNRHNETTITRNVDETKVFVGKNTKGLIDTKFKSNPNELLIIGDNVTIGENTKFIFGTKDLIIVKDGTEIRRNSIITR